MKTKKTIALGQALALILVALGITSRASANDGPFDLDVEEYSAGVRDHGLAEDTHVVGWQISKDFYFGRRQGAVDDFGFVFKRGDTQFSLTQDGIGWRHAISLPH